MTVEGSYAYVADDTNGLVILDISDPSNPTLAGSYDTATATISKKKASYEVKTL